MIPITVIKAAEILNLKAYTIRMYVKKGKLKNYNYTLSRRIILDLDEVNKLLEDHRANIQNRLKL
jgi:predicted site-specific integrase-resolvase